MSAGSNSDVTVVSSAGLLADPISTYDTRSTNRSLGNYSENATITNGSLYYDYDGQVDEFTMMFYYILWTFVAPTMFGIIVVVGLLGNSLVIYVILSKTKMRTATNFLLLNLAFSDIAFLAICVPLTAHRYAAATWAFGDVMCKLVSYVIYLTAYVTVYTLVAISALRYITVVHGMSTAQYRTKGNVVVFIVLLWIVIGLANITSITTHQTKVFDEHFSYCGMVNDLIKPFFLGFFIFGYALPLVIICLLYVIIILHLNKMRGSSSMERTRERTLRASKVIILVIFIFVLSWLPLHVNQLLSAFGRVPDGVWYEVFRIVCNCMAYGNSCVNPIIYNFVSEDFKKGFRDIFRCRAKTNSRHEHCTTQMTGDTAEKTAML